MRQNLITHTSLCSLCSKNSQNGDCTAGVVLDGLVGSPITVYAEAEQDGSALLPAGFTQGCIQFLSVQTQELRYVR